ncbi:hypothetical protein L226DRAFT_495257 [Lentinus tigrinus ALCF2SS1-7]|uniref:UvrD-like helicase ATP-binding domain-containing protein n=1 Tax=Lentinus tigrinus ALCF2SS1-6 TaxID=1328759 RepID=A0A5C2S691_9APHY|nr:hypothetical protein L227DRAFT_549079 [Lentinus tigrinus ALCF2SS1-6]RPD68757.1 hypothetical protein L226DRAFT_495257 [Lentinus tigrinus ALCF2SS1-7]
MSGSPVSPVDTKARAKGRVVGEAILSLFDTTSLHSEAAVESAVSTLDRHLSDLSVRFEDIYAVIKSVPYLVEFVLCASSDFAFRYLTNSIFQPHTHDLATLPSSIIPTLLTQFSSRLPDGAPRDLAAQRNVANALLSALECLAALQKDGCLADEDIDAPSPGRWAAKAHQGIRQKQGRSVRAGRPTSISTKPITDCGKEIPISKSQAMTLASEIVEQLASMLQEYFRAFRTVDVAALYKTAYLPHLLHVNVDAEAPLTQVQPAASKMGPWRIMFSSRAGRDLRNVKNDDQKRWKIVIGKIADLSHGYFTPDNQKLLSGGDINIPIYEAKMTGDSRLVYYIDCVYDHDSQAQIQVIKVFGIYTHAQIDKRFWDSASKQLRTISRDPEYRKRCIARKSFAKGDCVYLPVVFTGSVNTAPLITSTPSVDKTITKEQQEELHSLLVLEKFMTFSREVLKSILDDQDMTTVFDLGWLSENERKIMDHPSSCFALGRGGTGKTTTMVYKMISLERSWADRFQLTMRKPRQLFVTQSPELVLKVKEYYDNRSPSLALASHTPGSPGTAAPETAEQAKQSFLGADEVVLNSARYGELKDEDFPMFVTYHQLCGLLEAEYRYLVEEGKTSSTQAVQLRDALGLKQKTAHPSRRKRYVEEALPVIVDFDTFLEKYWTHFPESLLRDASLSPELVFGEIMGVIKGSQRALESEQGYLSEDVYCSIRRRSNASSMSQRISIYQIFRAYLLKKRDNGHYDAADRTRMLIKCFEILQLPRDSLPKFIYIDEAQDNLLIDALVLRKLCSNPDGMFWAGDTAQTISAGSAFRFQELKAFMYSEREKEAEASLGKCVQAETFHLTTNYRSHAGIVECANSVVTLLIKYWPDSVDRLPPEYGQIAGSKPKWYSSERAEVRRALFTDADSGASIDFGHKQCILVRNNAARDRLRKEMNSSIGTILTIYDSKGLEYDDVLLYNPFEDSTVEVSQWEVLLNEIPGSNGPKFDVGKHTGVCRELKHLYVAITRARKNLWILDSSESAVPIKRLWESKDLISVHQPGEPIERLGKSSSKDEWASAARNLFRKGQYSEAMHGFERAGLEYEQQVALAHLLRSQARATPVNPRVGICQADAFLKAADAFNKVADGSEHSERFYRCAAECYTRGGDDRMAGAAYRAAAEYSLAAQHYRKAGCFDEAVEVVRTHRDEVSSAVQQHIIEVSKLQYVRGNHIEKAKDLFDNDNTALAEYMDDYASVADCAKFHKDEGNHAKAAEYHIKERQWCDAARLLLRDRQSAEAARCILEGLWEHLSLCTPEENWSDPTIMDLLGFAEVLDRQRIPAAARNELAMFKAIFEDDIAGLNRLGDLFIRQEQFAAAVLCLDQVYSHPYTLQYSSLAEIASCFRTFLNLARTLQRLSCDPDPCNNRVVQKLLAFSASNDSSQEMFIVFAPSSHLYAVCNLKNAPGMQRSGRHLLVPRWELEPLVKETLRERLKGHVHEQKEAAHDLGPRLEPCVIFAFRRDCPKRDCRQIHVTEQNVNSTYNTLVRIRVIQIMIYHTLYASDIPFDELHKQQRVWLRRLYEALHPPHINLGALHTLSPDLIPELRQARSILKVWVRDFLNRIHPTKDTPRAVFFVNFMRATRLAILFDRRTATGNLHRIPCSMRFEWQRELTYCVPGHGSYYIVHDLIKILRCDGADALDRGVALLSHVVDRQVHMDINVLCDFMDHLCTAILIATQGPKTQCLHGLTLPTTWWIRIASDIGSVASMSTADWSQYTFIAERLLHAVASGERADYLRFERIDMSATNINFTRSIYIERICKNLFLLGHHLGTAQSKQFIIQALTTVWTESMSINPPLQNMTSRYLNTRNWDTLELNMSRTLAGYKCDRLIQFHHFTLSAPSSTFLPAGTRRIRYSKPDEIITLLGAQHIQMLSESSDAHSDVVALPPASLPRPPQHDQPPTSSMVKDGNESGTPLVEFTAAEESAAIKIATAFRDYMRRKAAGKDTLTEMRRRHLAEFQAKSETMRWPESSRSYGTLFRRAVPRLILALECLNDRLSETKAKAKARLSKVRHVELEAVQTELDEISDCVREVRQLRQVLNPDGTIHRMHDHARLEKAAIDTQKLHERLEGGSFAWRVDVDLAIALITKAGARP